MNTLTEELLAEVERTCFEAGRDNNHDFIMERLHECAEDNAERLLNDALEIGPGFEEASLCDLPPEQYDRLVFAYKDGFWENCHVQERRDLRDALTRLLNCPELNEDWLDDETIEATADAARLLARYAPPLSPQPPCPAPSSSPSPTPSPTKSTTCSQGNVTT